MMNHNRLQEAALAHTVLITTLDSLVDESQRDVALRLVREWFDLDKRTSIEEVAIRGAQAKILGESVEVPTFEPVKRPIDRAIFETLAKAWLTWAAGVDPSPLLNTTLKANEHGGAIHMMALHPWAASIQALARNDADEARRFFFRSIEIGSQYSTETIDVVKWTYAASFFHFGT